MDNRLDEILKEIQELKTEVREYKAIINGKLEIKDRECLYHTSEISNLKKIIEGNGKKGLKDRLDELEKFEVKVIAYATVIFSIVNFASFVIFKTVFGK